jgi:SagB-type dehydrogenase family enzyme
MRKIILAASVLGLALVCCAAQRTMDAGTATTSRVSLPPASKTGGMTLAQALATRRSVRSFTATALTQQELAQLLWAAQGVTDDRGHRTAPSARAAYYLHVYLATPEGFFEYVPAGHQLQRRAAGDLRAKLSSQASVTSAPAVLLIAGEYERAQASNPSGGARWVDLEAGHSAQNVLLQATALGLGAVPVGGIQPEQVGPAASLPQGVRAIYLIPVGHPK